MAIKNIVLLKGHILNITKSFDERCFQNMTVLVRVNVE